MSAPDSLRYRWLPGEFSVCRLEPSQPDPEWARGEGYSNLTRTANELSLVCLISGLELLLGEFPVNEMVDRVATPVRVGNLWQGRARRRLVGPMPRVRGACLDPTAD